MFLDFGQFRGGYLILVEDVIPAPEAIRSYRYFAVGPLMFAYKGQTKGTPNPGCRWRIFHPDQVLDRSNLGRALRDY